jgi:hypothetical protein
MSWRAGGFEVHLSGAGAFEAQRQPRPQGSRQSPNLAAHVLHLFIGDRVKRLVVTGCPAVVRVLMLRFSAMRCPT